jgi:hypothetical protein
LYSFGKNTETEPKLSVFHFVSVRTERKKIWFAGHPNPDDNQMQDLYPEPASLEIIMDPIPQTKNVWIRTDVFPVQEVELFLKNKKLTNK